MKRFFKKTYKPSFKDEIKDQNINLDKNDKIISEESELAEIFPKYFDNILESLIAND